MMRLMTALLTVAVFGWGSEATQAQDLSAAEMIEGFEGAVKKKNDAQAVSILELIRDAYPKFEEADQKKAVRSVAKSFGRRRDDGESALYIGALDVLSHMGELGLKAATKALKNKNVKSRADALAAAIRSIASHQDDKTIKSIIDYLVYKEPLVVAAAAETLGDNFSKKPAKLRKDLVKEIVKNYANYHSLAVANPREPIYREKLGVVERPMLRALAALTGLEHPDSPSWQKWYNDNKKKKWPEHKQDEG